MRKIIMALIVLVIVTLVTPKFIGSVVESEHQAMLEKMKNNPAISIDKHSFDRSWFSGQAITDITINLYDETVPHLTISIEEELLFGPVIFSSDGFNLALSHTTAKVNLKDFIADEEIQNFINDKVTITGLLTFSKDVIARITVDEMSNEVDGNKIFSEKAYGEFTLSGDKHLLGKFTWGGLTVNTSDENVVVGEVNMNIDQTLLLGDFYSGNALSVGDANFLMSSLKATDNAGEKMLAIDKLMLSVLTEAKDDLMKMKLVYSADEIAVMGESYKKANFEVALSNLDTNVLQEFNTFFAQVPDHLDDAYLQEHMAELSVLAGKLLEKEPLFEIENLSIETPQGKIQSTFNMSLDKNKFDPANVMSAIFAVNADANGSAPESFFAKLGLLPLLDAYIEQGFLVRVEENLTFEVTFSQGQLQVNGQVIPL
jgi:uncharacterized protein YdgA (DUF945 family)